MKHTKEISKRRKTSGALSIPLMKQTCRSNVSLAVAVVLIMCMMAGVINYATSIMGTEKRMESVKIPVRSYIHTCLSWHHITSAAEAIYPWKISALAIMMWSMRRHLKCIMPHLTMKNSVSMDLS